MAPVIVISAANLSAILVESGLSFLGLGAQPPIPSWEVL
jgi:peptide/nickel transport system permease protein